MKGRLTPIESRDIPLRLRHYELSQKPEFALEISKRIVEGKIANSIAMLARYQRNHPEVFFDSHIERLSLLHEEVFRKRTLDSLRGVEGQAAALYFECFGSMSKSAETFIRKRRPPTDPVNALLSFGYTLLYNEAIGVLSISGFDPYLGFFHGINYGRCSLALDLIEEFRHVVIDRLVITSINLGVFQVQHFEVGPEGGYYLKEEPRKRFLKEYEKFMTSKFEHGRAAERTCFRKALHEQALKLQKSILERKDYEPFKGWR
ncbi:MAG: CRISPR-associated endonuclease Cas1 [Acidobacteriota bacterium]|nr:CRISPR-associated endonuclease Cas1 [Acidobacteriota bacterium]